MHISFQISVFIYFRQILIAVARTSNTMLNKSGKSWHPCLVPDFRGNACSLSPWSMILAVGLSYVTFIMLRYVYTYLVESFCHKWILNFEAFSAST